MLKIIILILAIAVALAFIAWGTLWLEDRLKQKPQKRGKGKKQP